ncbi:MAG: hypothetical protein DSY80_03935 [Desulfocapsa sp.]|nr:MAG: hypothetical protein DSY80_03935 [Desulfocapsa sp.]
MELTAKEFGLPARTVLAQVDEQTIAIVMKRKSRIIMADGKKIVEKARKIQQTLPAAKVILQTTAPVCSKTIKFLENNDIQVVSEQGKKE